MLSLGSLAYLIIVIPTLLALYARRQVQNTYKKFRAVPNGSQLSGAEAAAILLKQTGLDDVAVQQMPGKLTDHYDPRTKTLRFSEEVATNRSVTSLGIVAHEIGHALQHREGFRPLQFRGRLADRLTRVGQVSPLVFLGGIVFQNLILMAAGVLMLAAFALFALISVPVERDASRRGIALLEQLGLTTHAEKGWVEQVLRAAAFTYAAALGQRVSSFALFALVLALALWGGQPQV